MKYQKLYFSMLKTFLKSDIKLNILIFLISVSAVFTFISLFCALNSGNAAYHNMMDRSGYIFDGIMPEDSPEFSEKTCPKSTLPMPTMRLSAIAQPKTTSVLNLPKLLLTKV